MEDELRDMKAHKAYYNMLHFVSDAQQGIPKLCPCGSITKEFVDEDDTYDYLPGKRYFICTDYQVRNVLSLYTPNCFAVCLRILCFGRMTGCILGSHG